MERFPTGRALFMRIEAGIESGGQVEQLMQEMSEELASDELGMRQLTAVRFYLQHVLWEAGTRWRDAAHGQTNYVLLADEIERWRRRANEQVVYVTFNYDLMLEDGLSAFLRPRGFDDYVEGPTKVLKVHGSVDWGHLVDVGSNIAGNDLRNFLIDHAAELSITATGWHRFRSFDDSRPLARQGGDLRHYLYPALALPTTGKAGFECPDQHIDELKRAVRDMTKLLVIGWRGQERHFLDVLATAANPVTAHVVSRQAASADALGVTLTQTIPQIGFEAFGGGFSDYAASNHLNELLAP